MSFPIEDLERGETALYSYFTPSSTPDVNELETNQRASRTGKISKEIFDSIALHNEASSLADRVTLTSDDADLEISDEAQAAVTESAAETARAFTELFDSKHLGENFQVRFQKVLEKIYAILATQSLDEKQKITMVRKEIKHFTEVQAKSTGWQGWIGVGSAVLNGLFIGASFIAPIANFKGGILKDLLPKVGDMIVNNGAKFLSSRVDIKSIQASSQQQLLMKELDIINTGMSEQSGKRREFKETLDSLLNTTQTASKSQ